VSERQAALIAGYGYLAIAVLSIFANIRPLADAGRGTLRLACAYLRAVKT
jgi:hypothetical protein